MEALHRRPEETDGIHRTIREGQQQKISARATLALVACILLAGPLAINGAPGSGAKSYWIYQGTVKYERDGRVLEKKLTWKSENTEIITSHGHTATAFKGMPQDLAWYAEGKPRGNYLLVQTGTRYHLLDGTQGAKALAALRSAQQVPVALLGDDDVFLDVSPQPGKPKRNDASYRWTVEGKTNVHLRGVAGLDPAQTHEEIHLVMRTRSDLQTLSLVRGIGIINYTFRHFGTTSEVDVKLVEAHLAQPCF